MTSHIGETPDATVVSELAAQLPDWRRAYEEDGLPMDIYALKQRIGERVALVGNVDMGLLVEDRQPEIEQTVGELAERLTPGGGYILSGGNSISADVATGSVLAMGNGTTTMERRPVGSLASPGVTATAAAVLSVSPGSGTCPAQ